MDIKLATQQQFGSVLCDFWQNENGDVFMTREQIGQALEYAEPRKAIQKIHERHERRLSKFSVVTKLTTTDGKAYETYIYNEKGIYEIIRKSQQPKADEFYDFVYDLLEGLRKGEVVLAQPKTRDTELEVKRMNAEARLLNARTRQASLILKMQKDKTLSPVAVELLQINALEAISEKTVEHRPQIEKSYTATEIANELGVSANKIGKLANANNLKTAEFGISVLDKSRYSNKQVETFRYNEKGKKRLKEIVEGVQ